MDHVVASTSATGAAAAPQAVHKKCEPVNVQVKEDGFCKLYYKVKGIGNSTQASWDFEERDGVFYAVFEATVGGTSYYNESLAIPPDVKDLISVDCKGVKKDYYKVKLTKKGQFKIGSYFSQKMG